MAEESDFNATKVLRMDGIEIDESSPYTPQENGRAERTNRTLLDCMRTMLNHSGLPAQYWAECLQHACDVRNLVSMRGGTRATGGYNRD